MLATTVVKLKNIVFLVMVSIALGFSLQGKKYILQKEGAQKKRNWKSWIWKVMFLKKDDFVKLI